MTTTVGDLREIAESILEQLEGYDDDRRIHVRCNDYNADYTLQVYDGFIEYEDIQVEDEDEDEDEDEEAE